MLEFPLGSNSIYTLFLTNYDLSPTENKKLKGMPKTF